MKSDALWRITSAKEKLTNLNHLESHEIYDGLWQEAMDYFKTGKVQTDSFLLDRQNDRRLGLTVIARPNHEVVKQIGSMLDHLKQIDPDQYYYQNSEIHITILSLFTATEDFEPHFSNFSRYLAAVDTALSKAKQFSVEFTGITASKSAVMVQGFPRDAQLDEIRERLRQALGDSELGQGLDTRYRIRTSHSTVMRFQVQPRTIEPLTQALKTYRETDFGVTAFTRLQLVKNDWYMSTGRVEVLAEYSLD